MKKIVLFIFLLLHLSVFSQSRELILPVAADSYPAVLDEFYGYDQFGFLYFKSDNAFIKAKSGQTSEYKNLSLGRISRADIHNPLLIILFYQSFNTIVLLDNQMNEIRKINLSELETAVVAHAAGLADRNQLWIYDSLTQQIGLYDYLNNSYRTITPSFKGNILHYETDFNTFQWVDDSLNRFSCDVFGKITPLGKVPAFDEMQSVSASALLYRKDGQLYYYSLNDDKSTLIDLGKKSLSGFWYNDQILSIFTKEGITNFKLTLP